MRNLLLKSFLLILLFSSDTIARPAIDSLNLLRSYLNSGELNGKLFVVGNAPVPSESIEMYDSSTGIWFVVELTTNKVNPFCRAVGNKMYIISASGAYLNQLLNNIVEYYDDNTGIWNTDTIPLIIQHFGSVEFDIKVHDGNDLVFLSTGNNSWGDPGYIYSQNTTTHSRTVDSIPDTLSSNHLSIHEYLNQCG